MWLGYIKKVNFFANNICYIALRIYFGMINAMVFCGKRIKFGLVEKKKGD